MSEEGFLDRLLAIATGHRRIIVVGRVDTGKSTLIKNMADRMDAYVLDADIGQNDISPPSTVSLGKRAGGQYKAIDSFFCGSTSPSGHFLQMIAGVSRLIHSCGKRQVLINTTGLATGEIGRVLKTEKINATRPDLIIGLQTMNELNYLHAFSRSGIEVIMFRPHPLVTTRSRTARAEVRTASFRRHFEGAALTTHRLEDIGVERSIFNNGQRVDRMVLDPVSKAGIVYAEVLGREAFIVSGCALAEADQEKIASRLEVDTIHAYRPSSFSGALVGLVDNFGKLAALGLLDSIDFHAGTIKVYSSAEDFSVIQFGSIKLDRNDFSSAGSFRPEVLRP